MKKHKGWIVLIFMMILAVSVVGIYGYRRQIKES